MTVRVLVLEDEPVIAVEIESALLAAGFAVMGCTGKVETALDLLEASGCDVAVLDANLRGQSSEPVADWLRVRGIAFVVVSGYGREALPPCYAQAPMLTKPFDPAKLVALLERLSAVGRARSPAPADECRH